MGNPSQSYGASLAIWDHTVLPATRHKWTRPAITPADQAGTRFTYPKRMEGWVDVLQWYRPDRESNPRPLDRGTPWPLRQRVTHTYACSHNVRNAVNIKVCNNTWNGNTGRECINVLKSWTVVYSRINYTNQHQYHLLFCKKSSNIKSQAER